MSIAQPASAAVRAQLGHPVIDADAHMLEFLPAVLEYVQTIGGSRVAEGLRATLARSDPQGFGWPNHTWYSQTPEERRDERSVRPLMWEVPARNTLDYATALMPKLFYERMDEIGLDFSVVYPTMGIVFVQIEDEELRRAACRGLNTYLAEVFRGFADRMTPAAAIPMHTPSEASEELEYVVGALGLKATMIPHYVERPIAAVARRDPEVARYARWLDTFGVDSEHDYDPFWAKCVELGVPPGAHTGAATYCWGSHRSISRGDYNTMGCFAEAGTALCKSLLMAGVTRRFPGLRIAMLEGGVAWASALYADTIGRWKKRNVRSIRHYDPANLDTKLLFDLIEKYGGPTFAGLATRGEIAPFVRADDYIGDSELEDWMLDAWAPCEVDSAEQIRDLFVQSFYFGCEADDPMNGTAFSRANPLGGRLNAMLGSDIGHWDVWDAREVLTEAYEPVERGYLSEVDFRDFTFENPARFYLDMNPDFFKGTVVEDAVAGIHRGAS